MMKKVASAINLGTLGVKVVTTRRTRAGGILLEVEGEEKAGILERRIREVVGEEARIRRPERKTPVLLLNIPEWVEAEDVANSLAKAGVTVAASSSGGNTITIRKNGGSRGDLVARVDLPFRDAIKLAEAKAVEVGWTRCRVKLLERKETTCFRCQQKGHFAAECRGVAKPRTCHRCNAPGHLAQDCSSQNGRRRKTSSRQTPSAEGARGEGEQGSANEQLGTEESSRPAVGRLAGVSVCSSSSDPTT